MLRHERRNALRLLRPTSGGAGAWPDLPLAVIDRTEIAQRSTLLPYRGVLSFARSTGDTGVKRREFITLLGAAAAWPLAARAQQPTKGRKIGVLHPGESTTVNMRVAAIREGFDGPDNQRDVSLEIIVRLADGVVSRLPSLATELVNSRVDAIVAAAPRALEAAAGATASLPVI